MITDAFLFHNEWECLELRVFELDPIVDSFLLVEANLTHMGEPREIAPAERIRSISPKISRVIVHLEKNENPRKLEYAQRNTALEAIPDPQPGDRILVSDVDEIPSREALEIALTIDTDVVAFKQRHFYYRLNLLDPEDWYGSRLIRYGSSILPQDVRTVDHVSPIERVVEGGWHFGWLGSAAKAVEKIKAFAHHELNTPEIANEEYIERCIRLRQTAHSQRELIRVEIDDSFPKLVLARLEWYRELIA